jgi:anti-sigma28 factor (negative regulator of flagellin synthesis)
MDTSKAAAITNAPVTPSSTPVRRSTPVGAPAQARPSETGSGRDLSVDSGDSVELSPQGKAMAGWLAARQAKSGEAPKAVLPSTPEEFLHAVDDQEKTLAAQEKVVKALRKKEEEAIKGKGELTEYEKTRLARLDQIQLLIDQGKYQVDNFMVDRVAVDLAKLMV